jgi:hypothetical protein
MHHVLTPTPRQPVVKTEAYNNTVYSKQHIVIRLGLGNHQNTWETQKMTTELTITRATDIAVPILSILTPQLFERNLAHYYFYKVRTVVS